MEVQIECLLLRDYQLEGPFFIAFQVNVFNALCQYKLTFCCLPNARYVNKMV